MVSSKATTVADYLKELPPERRAVIAQVRGVIRKNLPKGFVETMNWGMIAYEVPLKIYPDTYNKQPLMYAALAAQKNNFAVYLMTINQDEALLERFRQAYRDAGKTPDMGKSCIRFKAIEELSLDAVADAIGALTMKAFITRYEASRGK